MLEPTMLQLNSMPRFHSTRFGRLTASHSLVLRLLALVGIVLLIERSINLYLSATNRAHHDLATNFTNDDGTLSFSKHDSGLMPNGETKAIVVASTTWEDTSWIAEHLSDWNMNIYVVNVRPPFLLHTLTHSYKQVLTLPTESTSTTHCSSSSRQ